MYWLQDTRILVCKDCCQPPDSFHPLSCLFLTLFLGSFQPTGALHSITSANVAECLFFLTDTETVLQLMMLMGPGRVIYLVLNLTFALVDRTWAVCPLCVLSLIRLDATHANDLRVRQGCLYKLYERKNPDNLNTWKDILCSWME